MSRNFTTVYEGHKRAQVFQPHVKQTWYVCNLPGDGGKDWGYTNKPDEAILLNPYWQRRFAVNCLAVNRPVFSFH